MPEQLTRFHVQCKTRSDSYAGMVLQYLNAGEHDLTKQELVVMPLLAHWLPEALRDHFKWPETEVKRGAQYAVYLLELQKTRLMYEFGVEPTSDLVQSNARTSSEPAIAREEADGDAAQGQADGAARNRAHEADGTDAADPDRVRREETKRFAQEGGHDDWANRIFGG